MKFLLPSADLFKKGCCQLQGKVCAQITGKPLAQACPGKSVVKWTDRPAMTTAVDMGRKATKTNKQTNLQNWKTPGLKVIKLWIVLNSIEHEILAAHKN